MAIEGFTTGGKRKNRDKNKEYRERRESSGLECLEKCSEARCRFIGTGSLFIVVEVGFGPS